MTFEGNLNGRGLRFGLVASRFNDFIVKHLVEGAQEGLRKCGVGEGDVDLVRVPGAMEIPAAAKQLAQVALQTGVPSIFAVVTAENIEQAIERGGAKMGNKGYEGALAAVEM